MMYNAPVSLCSMEPFTQAIKDDTDEYVYKMIIRAGVNVDKDELIKALKYDRDQYEKGFRDGVESCREQMQELKNKIVSIIQEV